MQLAVNNAALTMVGKARPFDSMPYFAPPLPSEQLPLSHAHAHAHVPAAQVVHPLSSMGFALPAHFNFAHSRTHWHHSASYSHNNSMWVIARQQHVAHIQQVPYAATVPLQHLMVPPIGSPRERAIIDTAEAERRVTELVNIARKQQAHIEQLKANPQSKATKRSGTANGLLHGADSSASALQVGLSQILLLALLGSLLAALFHGPQVLAGAAAAVKVKRTCAECETEVTPKWREDVYCNACGLRKKRKRAKRGD